VSFTYGSEYKPTQDGKMMLTLSGDKKVISLAVENEDLNDNGERQIELKAWNVKDLSELKIPKDLQNCFNMPSNCTL